MQYRRIPNNGFRYASLWRCPHPKVWTVHNNFLPNSTINKGGIKVTNVEKPDKHNLSQVIKVNINRDKLC